jgi:2-octaprenyl-6-methoxyphenol hydroxylase
MARSTSPRAVRTKAKPLQAEVVVVGGGLSGLTMAAALGSSGVNVICLDRDAPKDQLAVKFDGRTTAVSYGSMQILKGCGIWQKLADVAEPIRQIRVTDQNSPLHLHFPEGAVNGQPLTSPGCARRP